LRRRSFDSDAFTSDNESLMAAKNRSTVAGSVVVPAFQLMTNAKKTH